MFAAVASQHLPPQRRITQDEASSTMHQAAAPPPAPAANSTRPASGAPTFANTNGLTSNMGYVAAGGTSAGHVGVANYVPVGAASAADAAAYGGMGITRLGASGSGNVDGGITGNTRKKARLG